MPVDGRAKERRLRPLAEPPFLSALPDIAVYLALAAMAEPMGCRRALIVSYSTLRFQAPLPSLPVIMASVSWISYAPLSL